MIIDCQSCPVRDLHCDDCMVTALVALEAPRAVELALDAAERVAVSRFAAAGLVSAQTAAEARAHREPWARHVRAVG
jgi:hypothetical protein